MVIKPSIQATLVVRAIPNIVVIDDRLRAIFKNDGTKWNCTVNGCTRDTNTDEEMTEELHDFIVRAEQTISHENCFTVIL